MPPDQSFTITRLYNRQEWWIAGTLLVSYLTVYEAVAYLLPSSTGLHPATAIALCALFFGGVRLWPAAYLTALLGVVFAGLPLLTIVVAPVSVTLQAVLGTYLLRRAEIDPLFRRFRDAYYLILTILAVSVISPAFEALGAIISRVPYVFSTWGQAYVGAIFTYVIVTPFLLRWFAKPRFKRQPAELFETIGVMAAVVVIDYVIFVRHIFVFWGVPLAYLLLVPLFLIALRLRPRFVTLALLLTSIIAIGSALTAGDTLRGQLFSIETFLIALAVIFNIIAALEEDRRVSSNLAKSQLATLENAIARIRTESNAKNDFIAILAHELRNPPAGKAHSTADADAVSSRSGNCRVPNVTGGPGRDPATPE